MRINLADHEYLLAPPGNRLADDFLGAAVAIHLGGVHQGPPQIEPERNGGGSLLPAATRRAPRPGAQRERRQASVRTGNPRQETRPLCPLPLDPPCLSPL